MLRVTTWNVLHRVHAVNWKEQPVQTFPDEAVRIAGITARVVAWLADGAVVCLQEVSGDQVASLRAAIREREMHVHRYPRMPHLRDGGPPALDDPSEHLVTIAPPGSRPWRAATFATDPGKGFVAVALPGGVVVINTHVSARERGPEQMQLLGQTARQAPAGAVVLGDFNAPADRVRTGLGEPLSLSEPPGDRPTRVATSEHPSKRIDHVAAFGGSVASAEVLDGEGLSDHHPVTATLRFGPGAR